MEIGRIIQSAAAASHSPLPSSRPPPAKNNLTLHIEPRGGDRQNHSVCRRRLPLPPPSLLPAPRPQKQYDEPRGDRQNHSVCRRRLPLPFSLLPAPARKTNFDAAYRTARWRSAESLSLPPPLPLPLPSSRIGRIIQSAAAASPSPPPPRKNLTRTALWRSTESLQSAAAPLPSPPPRPPEIHHT